MGSPWDPTATSGSSTSAPKASEGSRQTGTVTEFTTGISPNSGPQTIVAGPDGNMWFTERAGARIARTGTAVASCTANTGTVKLSPGLTSTPAIQTVKIKGTITGCEGDTFTQVQYKATLQTTATVACSALKGAGESATGTAQYKWTPKAKASTGTLSLLVTETPSVAFLGEVSLGSYSPLKLSGTTAGELYRQADLAAKKLARKPPNR